MERVYKIADKKIRLHIPYNNYEDKHIELFRHNLSGNENVDINYKTIYKSEVFTSDKEKICEFKDLKVYRNDDRSLTWRFIDVNNDETYSYLLDKDDSSKEIYIPENKDRKLYDAGEIFRRINIQGSLLRKGVIILHSNFIIHDNEAILFTAPSGTGKSTQGSLWERYKDAEVINGDRSTIALKNNEYYAYGFPFSGSSNICKNKEAKLKAIVAIEQAKENSVRKLSDIEAFKFLFKEIAINRWNKEEVKIAMTLIEELISKVPVLFLSCRPDEEATDVLYEELLRL
ncbi:hypothetical protein [Clostridium disporicum]